MQRHKAQWLSGSPEGPEEKPHSLLLFLFSKEYVFIFETQGRAIDICSSAPRTESVQPYKELTQRCAAQAVFVRFNAYRLQSSE